MAGDLLHLVLQRGGGLLQLVGDRLELAAVDGDAGDLHLGEDPDEGALDVIVQLDHVVGGEARAEAVRHGEHVGGLAGRVLGQVGRGLAGVDDLERELAGLLPELLELVLAGRRVEQVGGDAGVHLEAGEVDAEGQEGAHQLLHVVAEHGLGQEGGELLGDRRRGELFRRDQHAEPGLFTLGGEQQERDQVAASGHAVPTSGHGQLALAEFAELLGRLGGGGRERDVTDLEGGRCRLFVAGRRRFHPGTGHGPGQRLAEGARVEQFDEALPDRLHLVFLEGGLRPRRVPTAQLELSDVHVERHVAHERDEAGVAPGQVLVLLEVLAQLGRLFGHMAEDAVEVAVLVDQLGGGLLPYPRDAGQIVGGVAAQGGQEDVLVGGHAGALLNARLVVEGVVADAALVVEHPDVRVLHELVAVAVAGDDHDLAPALRRLGREGGDDVVRLEPGRLDDRDRERVHDLADDVELGRQEPRRGGATRLVVLEHLVAERVTRERRRQPPPRRASAPG